MTAGTVVVDVVVDDDVVVEANVVAVSDGLVVDGERVTQIAAATPAIISAATTSPIPTALDQ